MASGSFLGSSKIVLLAKYLLDALTNVYNSRMESVNFVHDVNMLRKTIKAVYSQSPDLKAFNSESGDGPGNCGVQVLPVCWRHLLDFPKRREKKGERDLGDAFNEEDECEHSR